MHEIAFRISTRNGCNNISFNETNMYIHNNAITDVIINEIISFGCLFMRHLCFDMNYCKTVSQHNLRYWSAGCRLGEVSQFYAVKHAYVRIPSPDQGDHFCHRICQCGHDGLLHRCHQVACVRRSKCLLDTGRIEGKDIWSCGIFFVTVSFNEVTPAF